jgi:hypothetical protein
MKYVLALIALTAALLVPSQAFAGSSGSTLDKTVPTTTGWTWDDRIAPQVCGYCDGGGLPPCTLNNLGQYINGFWCNVPNYWSGPTWTYIG